MAKGRRPKMIQANVAAETATLPFNKHIAVGAPIFFGVCALVLNGPPDNVTTADPDMKTYTFYLDQPERPGVFESIVSSFANDVAPEEKIEPPPVHAETVEAEVEGPGFMARLKDWFSFSSEPETVPEIVPQPPQPVWGDMSLVKYDVPVEANSFMEKYSTIRRVPISIASNIFGSESGFKIDAESSSGALGVGQFVPSTALEEFYKNRDHYPQEARDIINANIEEYNIAAAKKPAIYRYRIKAGGSQEAIDELAKNMEVSIGAGFSFMAFSIDEGSRRFFKKVSDRIAGMEKRGADFERLAEMSAQLQRPLIAADLKTFYVCGVEGGAGLLEALADPVKRAGNHAALDYARDSTVNSNWSLFHKPNGAARNIVEFYEEMIRLVGEEQIPENLVTTRPQANSTYVAANTLEIN